MKEILTTALSIAVVALAVACTIEKPVVTETPEKINVAIDGIMGAYSEPAGTKSEIETVARLKWNNGDKVYAYDGTAYLGELTASVEETDRTYAKLSGSIDAPSGGKSITLVHSPLFTGQPTVTGGKISLDFSRQTSESVPFLVYCVLPANTTAEKLSNNYVAKFTIATSIYKCNVAGMTESGSVSQLRVSNTNTVCNLQLSDSEEPGITGSNPGVLARSAGIAVADQRAITTVALVPSPAVPERKIEAFKGKYAYTANFSKSAITSAQSYNAVFVLEMSRVVYIENDAFRGAGISVLGDWNEDGNQTTLYWAPVNCGYEETGEVNTDSDHRLGKFYQWGAGDSSLPYYYDGTHVVAREMYYDTTTPSPWYNSTAITGTKSDKWNNNQGPCPEGWRLPTSTEFKVLSAGKNGTFGWVSAGTYAGQVNTYAGAELFGENSDKTAGNGVFFPAAGYCYNRDGKARLRSTLAHYWSSTPNNDDDAYELYNSSSSVNGGDRRMQRSAALSVRCVTE